MYWATRVSSVGFAMVLPTGLGYWLDTKWGTAPWLVVVGACLGFAAAMLEVMKLAKLIEKTDSKSGPPGPSGK